MQISLIRFCIQHKIDIFQNLQIEKDTEVSYHYK